MPKIVSFGRFARKYRRNNPHVETDVITRKYRAAMRLMFGDPREVPAISAEDLAKSRYLFPIDSSLTTDEFVRLDGVSGCDVLPEWMNDLLRLLLTETELRTIARKPVHASKRFGNFIFGGCGLSVLPLVRTITKSPNWIGDLIYDTPIWAVTTRARPLEAMKGSDIRTSMDLSPTLSDEFAFGTGVFGYDPRARRKKGDVGKGFYGFLENQTCKIAMVLIGNMMWSLRDGHARILVKDSARKAIYMFDPHGFGNMSDGVLIDQMKSFLYGYEDSFNTIEVVQGPIMQSQEGSCVLLAFTRAVYLAFQFQTNPGGDVRAFLAERVPCVFPVFASILVQKADTENKQLLSARAAYRPIESARSIQSAKTTGSPSVISGPIRIRDLHRRDRVNALHIPFAAGVVGSTPAYRDLKRTDTVYVILPVALLVACIQNLDALETPPPTESADWTLRFSLGYVPPAWPVQEVRTVTPTRAMFQRHGMYVEDDSAIEFVTAYLRTLDPGDLQFTDEKYLLWYIKYLFSNNKTIARIPIVFIQGQTRNMSYQRNTVVVNVGRLDPTTGEEKEVVSVQT